MWIIVAAIAFYLAASLLSGFELFRTTSKRRPTTDRADPALYGKTQWAPFGETLRACRARADALPYETLRVVSEDGLALSARYYPADFPSRGTALLSHGYDTMAINNFSPVFFHYRDLRFNILLIDQRAHGASEGTRICYGSLEKRDLVLWIKTLDARADAGRIVLHGVSMGASIAMMAAGEDDLPDSVAGYVADCGFTAARREFGHLLRQSLRLPAFPTLLCTLMFYRLLAHANLGDDTRRAVAKSKLPALFIHGANDRFIPPVMSLENYEAAGGEADFVAVKGAAHAVSFLVDPETCTRALDALLARAGLLDKP